MQPITAGALMRAQARRLAQLALVCRGPPHMRRRQRLAESRSDIERVRLRMRLPAARN
ncbi:hypothetical protein PSAC2689_120082 [Paraburkholderia sacchari]